jgi:predicted MFS family arabinose efflux permease
MTPSTAASAMPRLTLAILAFANFAVGMGAFVVVGVLSPLAQSFGVARGEAGAVMTAYALVYAVASPLLVATTGHFDRARTLAAGMLLFGIGALLSALAPSFALLLAARGVMALGAAIVTPVAATVGVALVVPAQRGRALSIVFGGLTLAQVAGVPAGAWLGYTFGWQSAFAVVTALSALGTVLLVLQLPRGIDSPGGGLASLGAVLSSAMLMTAVAFTALFIGALYVVYTFLGPFFEQRHGLGRDGVTLMLLVFGAGAVAGNALGGTLTDRVGPVRTLLVLCAAQILLMPMLTLTHLPVAADGALVGVWSVFGWSFMVAQQARLAGLAPDRVPVLFALNASAIYVGASLGSAIGARLLGGGGFDILGPGGAVLAALALASIGLVRWLAPPRG